MWRHCLHQVHARDKGADNRTSMEFNAAIAPLVTVSRVFGLGPYVLSVGTEPRRSYVTSTSSFAYSVIWFAGMLFGLVFSVPVIFLDRPQKMAPIMETTSTLQAICGILVFVFSHLVCLFNRRKILNMISKTAELGESLGLSSSHYSTLRRVILLQITAYFVFEIISASLLVFGWNIPLTANKLVTFTLIGIAELSSSIAELQFVNFVLVLNFFYKTFCMKLYTVPKKSTERCVDSYLPAPTMTVELDGEYTCREAAGNGVKETSGDEGGYDCFGGLDVSELHCSLHDISQAVGSMFGFQNLLFIVNDFCALLYGLYFMSDSLLGLSAPGDTTALWLAYVVFEGAFRCLRLVVMVTACTLATSQAQELAYTVSKLQTSAKDARMRSQMQVFSSQLVHRKISFTASGFLPIDASLISAIVGGVTTYLVIIIQFQMMTPPTMTSSTPQPISNDT